VKRPAIAVVGSVQAHRKDELGLNDVDRAPTACEGLGRALAEDGWNLVVYSSDPKFIEADVVRGYVASGKAVKDSINLRYPPGGHGRFPEMDTHDVFKEDLDTSDDWEVSFYLSLTQVDGVLLVGGGQSTLIAGVIAISLRKPVVALETFGGNARKVRKELGRYNSLASADHVSTMGKSWSDSRASELVSTLREQRDVLAAEEAAAGRSAARQRKDRTISSWVGVVTLLGAIAAMLVVFQTKPGSVASLAALFAGPLLAGVCGAIIQNLREGGGRWAEKAFFGLGAGAIAALLFLVSQLATSPGALEKEGVDTLAAFVVAIGLAAGMTSERVFSSFRKQQVVDPSVLEPR
jgi:hypothetical protein